MSAVQPSHSSVQTFPQPEANRPSDRCDPACRPAFHFLGQYALRCSPVGSDTSCMSIPARIDSIDPNGNLKTHFCTLKGKEWLDQWRAVTPQEFPECYLYNQCAELAKREPEKGTQCQNHVRSIAETFFRRPQTSDPQERFIQPLPDRKPLNHLYSQCKRLRTEEEDRIINNPPVIEYLRNIYSSARHSERMDSKEGSCKRDVTALKKLFGI